MATLQSVLTAYKNGNQLCNITLQNGQSITGFITDDGSTGGDDAIIMTHRGSSSHSVIPKVAIMCLPPYTDIVPASPAGQGTNSARLI